MEKIHKNSCDPCRKRKIKCSKENPCSSCIQLGKKCVYTPRPKRNPITKKYVDGLKLRIRQLESRLASNSVPDPDQDEDEVPIDEYNIDKLEWNEPDYDESRLIDGMGIISRNKSKTYYGNSSNHELIKLLNQNSHLDYSNILTLSDFTHDSSILDNEVHRQSFLDSYFEIFHPIYPVLDENSFRNQYHSNNSDIFQILINTVLSIGSLMKLGENSNVDLQYYQRVKFFLNKISFLEIGNFQLLECLVLLGNYCQKRNKINTSWNYHGLAIRMSLSFGNHKEIPLNNHNFKNIESLERRKRLWWELFFFDIGHSLTFGRPLHIPLLESINIKYPLNLEVDEKINHLEDLPNFIKKYPTLNSSIIYESKLSKICYVIYGKLNSNDFNHYIELNEMIEIFILSLPEFFHEDDNKVNIFLQNNCPTNWFNEAKIPNWFSLVRKRLIWRYKNLQNLLFKSFIVKALKTQSDDVKKSCKKCFDNARYNIISIANFVQTDLLSLWYSTFFIFQSSLILILVLKSDNMNHDEILELIELSKVTLSKFNIKLSITLINTIDELIGKDGLEFLNFDLEDFLIDPSLSSTSNNMLDTENQTVPQ